MTAEEHFIWTTKHTETSHSSVQPHHTAFISDTDIHTKRTKLAAYSMNNMSQTHTCRCISTTHAGPHGSKRSNMPGTKVVRAYRIPQRQCMPRQSTQSLQSHCCGEGRRGRRGTGTHTKQVGHLLPRIPLQSPLVASEMSGVYSRLARRSQHLGTTASTSHCYDVEREDEV